MAENVNLVDDRHSAATSRLTALELSVVALARSKSERIAVARHSRAGRLIDLVLAITGERDIRPLANPRLEALRRLAVILYHRSDRGAATTADSLATGLSIDDIEAVRAIVRGAPAASRSLIPAVGLIASGIVLAGCSTVGKDRIAERDPLQKFNRGMWGVNRSLDKAIIKPTSVAYRKVVPRIARRGVTGVFANLTEPW